MGLGTSIFVFAIGAILRFGVTASAEGLDLNAIGVILMVIGAIGAVVTAFLIVQRRSRTDRTIVREAPHDHSHEHTTRER